MIRNVNVHAHKKALGKSQLEHAMWTEFIQQITISKLGDLFDGSVDVYNMLGSFYDFNAGNRERFVIFGNATREGAPGKYKPRGDGLVLKDPTGIELAEYFRDTSELYILSDIFEKYDATHKANFELIINLLKKEHFDKLALEHSWIHTSNKEALTARFKERVQQALRLQIDEDKRNERQYSQGIEEYKRKIKQHYDNMLRMRRNIELAESNIETAGSQLLKDLDLIIAHKAISDLHIKDGIFHLYIPKIYAYDEDDNRYYIGNFRVEINIENTDVRFFGDNGRQSYWTGRDPHPHVNGSDGRACLGNISSTIAELCSRNEIYALALVCIDFLESVNTEDPAGRNIKRWDMVDEEGNVISEGRDGDEDEEEEYDYHCEDCGEGIMEGDQYYVYEDAYLDDDADIRVENGRTVCESCRSVYYIWNEEVGEHIHQDSSIWQAIEERDAQENDTEELPF